MAAFADAIRGGVFLSTLPARGATRCVTPLTGAGIFLSTLPARGATRHQLFADVEPVISIHAPREGSDNDLTEIQKQQALISIHAPREGSDQWHLSRCHSFPISIHAPREGSDPQ